MKLAAITCKVLYREMCYAAALSKNIVDIYFLEQQLHNEPDKLRSTVQHAIRQIEENGPDKLESSLESGDYDAIILGYGLCSNGILSLYSKKYKIVVPRAHDCITLLLGSKEKYREYFDSHDGVYWYTSGWVERSLQPSKERFERNLNHYKEKYGEDNAKYLMDMEQGWYKNYNYATYIDLEELPNKEYNEYTKECAEYLKWNYDEVKGNLSLMHKMVNGDWDDKDFLVLQPKQRINAAYDNRIIKAD